MTRFQMPPYWILVATSLLGIVGCAGVNRLGDKMDIATTHLDAPGQPQYEGQLDIAKKIGDMTSLQFVDGKFYDVNDAPSSLMHGDMVRVYHTDDGYVARLWKANDDNAVATNGLLPLPSVRSGS